MSYRGLACGLALAALLSASPASAQSRREMQMMADLRMLQEQTQLLQQQLNSALEQLTATLKTINSRIDDQNSQTRKSFADQKLASFKVPKRIVILEEIPKGATGKLQRIGLAQKLGLK